MTHPSESSSLLLLDAPWLEAWSGVVVSSDLSPSREHPHQSEVQEPRKHFFERGSCESTETLNPTFVLTSWLGVPFCPHWLVEPEISQLLVVGGKVVSACG